MFDLQLGLIQGMSVGIEFPPLMEMDEDILFCVALDLVIFRVMLIKWRVAE